MRIAICSDQYLPMLSGIADSIETFAIEMRRRGHAVRIYGPDLPGSAHDTHVHRFPAYAVPGTNGAIMLNFPGVAAMHDIRAFKPDIIHTHLFGAAGFFAWYAARRLKIPLVGTDHTFPADYLHYVGLNFWPVPDLVKRYASWYYNRCAFVTTPSEKMLRELRAYSFSRPARVISNPIPAHFRPLEHKAALKNKYGIAERAVAVFGRISVEKNLDAALAIFDAVAEHTDAQLVMIGDGDDREKLHAKAAQLRSAPHIKWVGMHRGEGLVELLNACDIFLMTSLVENQSMALLQAMMCGLPPIAPRSGGTPELITDGVSGYLVEPEHLVEKGAQRVRELLENPAEARSMGAAALKQVAHLSPSAIAEQFEKIYADVVKTKSGR